MASEEGQVIGCHTVEAWNEQLEKGNATQQLVFFLFISFNSPFDFMLSCQIHLFVD